MDASLVKRCEPNVMSSVWVGSICQQQSNQVNGAHWHIENEEGFVLTVANIQISLVFKQHEGNMIMFHVTDPMQGCPSIIIGGMGFAPCSRSKVTTEQLPNRQANK